MKIRRVGDSLLRSQISPFTLFTPSIPSRCPSMARRTLNSLHRKQFERSFASSARYTAKSVSVTTSASPPAEDVNGVTSENTSKPLDWLTGTSSSRTSRLSSPQAQTDNRAISSNVSQSEMLMNKGNSADDLLRGLNAARASYRSSKNLDVDRMAYSAMPKIEVAEMMKDISKDINNAPSPARTPMRLTPSTGRTVYITPQIDVGKGFRLMEQLVARNKIRATFNYQRFHERPGLKRKRLHSLRWRKRFMAGFKAAVNRVKQLKKQGW